MTLGADLAPRDALGEFLGVWRLIGDGGFMGAPLIVGSVADALDLSFAAVVMAGVGFAAAAVFAYRVPETLQKKPSLGWTKRLSADLARCFREHKSTHSGSHNVTGTRFS